MNNYLEYVSAAFVLFPELYNRIDEFDRRINFDDYYAYYSEALKSNDLEAQINILNEAIGYGIYTPYTYDNLAKAYEKKKEVIKAHSICLAWFETGYWKLPNMSNGSLKLLKRLKRLEGMI